MNTEKDSHGLQEGRVDNCPLVQVIVEDPDKVNPDLQVTSYVAPEFIVSETGSTVPS